MNDNMKYILLFIPVIAFADVGSWDEFLRPTAPGPETLPTEGVMIVNGVEFKSGVMINRYYDFNRGIVYEVIPRPMPAPPQITTGK